LRRRFAWLLFGLAVALAPVGIGLALVGERRGLDLPADTGSELILAVFAGVAALLFAVVGLLIAREAPGNAIGWLFLGSASALALVSVAYGYTEFSLDAGGEWIGTAWAGWLASWLIIVPAFTAPCLIAQLFPDGRPMAGRWRGLFRLSVGLAAYLALAPALQPGPLGDFPTIDNPTGLPNWVDDVLVDPTWGAAIFTLFWVSLASVAVRFRRSRGVERQQLTWLALAAGVAIAGLALAFAFLGVVNWLSNVFMAVAALGFVMMPLAVAVAILRYRLYEIDRIVSRTLTYAVLTAVLAAAYAGLVLGSQALFSSFAGGSDLAIAVSTLVVAALFLPVRSRVQGFVDRRFNRRRYDAQQTLEAFGVRLRDQIELDALARDLRGVVSETMQPVHASLWLRTGARG
jgi:hypothetical protein